MHPFIGQLPDSGPVVRLILTLAREIASAWDWILIRRFCSGLRAEKATIEKDTTWLIRL